MARLPDFSRRATVREWMDDPAVPPEEVAAALRDLERINVALGVRSALARHLFPRIERLARSPVRILDVATGAADIPRAIAAWARRRGRRVEIVALDRGWSVLRYARHAVGDYPEIALVCADARHLPFPRDAFDFVIATEFVHHLADEEIVPLLRRLAELAREAFVINDLRRHPIAYYGFRVLSRFFFRSRLVRHDGPISILRGFTVRECERFQEALGLRAVSLHRHFPYRFILIGER
ncbi:Ubiquinone/menaquinone biosynthesis C-methyltransferase UbiE [bacterium HR08]|nr:Ubiquinone/menaquinone biosynthesis C-methyltransferase UbiE [bacterium HR08]